MSQKLLIFLTFVLSACATKSVKVSSNVTADVSVVEMSNLMGEGKSLGKTPATLAVDDVKNKVVRITAEGKIPMYWMHSAVDAATLDVSFSLQDIPTKVDETLVEEVGKRNQTMRMVFQAYRAVIEEDTQSAIDLAKSAIAMDPFLAMPHIVLGMALINQGNAGEAKSSFQRARALDPDDKEIATLLDLVGQ